MLVNFFIFFYFLFCFQKIVLQFCLFLWRKIYFQESKKKNVHLDRNTFSWFFFFCTRYKYKMCLHLHNTQNNVYITLLFYPNKIDDEISAIFFFAKRLTTFSLLFRAVFNQIFHYTDWRRFELSLKVLKSQN